MPANLIEMAKSYLTSAVTEKLSNAAGLSPEKTQKSMEAMIPTALGGLIQGASSDSGAKRIFDMLGEYGRSAPGDPSKGPGDLDEMIHSGRGMLSGLFGEKLDNILGLLTSFTGSNKSSILTLLGAAASLVMKLLGKLKTEQGLSVGGLRELLLSQKDAVAESAPPGLASALGLGSLPDLGGAAASKERGATYAGETVGKAREVSEPAATRHPQHQPSAASRWVPIALACLGALAAIWFLRDRGSRTASVTPDEPPALRGEPVGILISTTLPSGATIELPVDSTALKVADSLQKVPSGPYMERFAFSEMIFEAGATQPNAAGSRALEHLARVLKEHPDVHARIRAHAPSSADAAQRADRIKESLAANGVSADRLQAEGSEQPLAEEAGGSGLEIVLERRAQ